MVRQSFKFLELHAAEKKEEIPLNYFCEIKAGCFELRLAVL